MADSKIVPQIVLQKRGVQNGAEPVEETREEALGRINRELKEKAVKERAKEINMPYIDLSAFPVNPDVLHFVSPEDAKKAGLMPFFKFGKKIKIAVSNPDGPEVQEVLKKLEGGGYGFELNLASDIGIKEAQKLYESEQYKPVLEQKIIAKEKPIYEEELKNLAALKEKIETLPAEEALSTLHAGAISAGASDIHYQPEEKLCEIRFRIDGVLHKVFDISKDTYKNILNQVKYKAKMKLNVADVPQDGRFSFSVNERKIDVRVSALPTEFGEAVVCRILDTGKKFSSFEELGFMRQPLALLKKAAGLSYGMVLCTGPTGCGKTTTLYALLTQMSCPEVKIITLEDPIEYHLSGIIQSQIDEKRDYNFVAGLRSVLRQDPDIVMIGEIRDRETAETACQAALTGHVLLSTLHTNNAVDAVLRLITIGVAPFLVSPALHTIITQRLVRRICGKCAKERKVNSEERKVFEKTLETVKTVQPQFTFEIPESLKEGKGCEECNFTGYRGQMAIAEVLTITDEVKTAILNNASSGVLFELSRKQGMLTMQEDGILKAMLGHTTLHEVFRVSMT